MEGGFTGLGSAAVYASVVETRMASIQGIISKFEADDRDGMLVADAEAPVPRWTADEWAALGTQSREREWIKTDLNAWAVRVAERAKATQAAATISMEEGDDASAHASSAFDQNYKGCVKKLRELGVKMLQLASMSEQRQLSHAEIRKELDDTIVGALAPMSNIVDRGMDANTTRRTKIDVPSNDVFRASALQQRLVAKMELQLAEREALLATVRREADDNYHAWMRAEERIRHVTLQATQKPPQRSRAVDCNIPMPSCSVAVQVDAKEDDGDGGDASAHSPSIPNVGHVGYSRTQSGRQAPSSPTRETSSRQSSTTSITKQKGTPNSTPGAHEVFLLQNKLNQQRFMFLALLALYRKAKLKLRGPVTRTRHSQTDVVSATDVQRAEQRALDAFAHRVLDGVDAAGDAVGDGDGGGWSDSVVAAIDAAMAASPHLDLVDARTRAMSRSTSSRCSSMTPVEAMYRPVARTASARTSPLPASIAIGELVGSNSASIAVAPVRGGHQDVVRRVAQFTQPRDNTSTKVVGTVDVPQQAGKGSSDGQLLGEAAQPVTARHARQPVPRWVESTGSQTNRLLLRDEASQTETLVVDVAEQRTSQPLPPSGLGWDVGSSALLRCTVAAEIPESLDPMDDEDRGDAGILTRQSTRAYVAQEEPTERFSTSHAAPMHATQQPSGGARTARPFSAHRSSFVKKYTVIAPQDLLQLSAMEARTKTDAMMFSRWRDELLQLKQVDTEAVLASPRVDSSSHHFPPTASDRCGGVSTTSPPPRCVADHMAHNAPQPTLPSTTVLTQQGIADKRVPSRPVSPAASRGRPQPLVVPRVW